MKESLFSKQLLQCPVCLNEEPVTLWPVVDAAADPDLKEMLLRKDLLTHICSNCGHAHLIGQPLLYRDPDIKLMVYCHPGLTVEQARMAVRGQPDLPGWQLRLVAGINQLIEKIHIADHHGDDRLVEFIKLAVIRQDTGEEPITALYFLTADDRTFRFMTAGTDRQWQPLDLDSRIYLNAEAITAGHLADISGKWQVIDQEYARGLLAEIAGEPAAASMESGGT
jgi:hypothetical protein